MGRGGRDEDSFCECLGAAWLLGMMGMVAVGVSLRNGVPLDWRSAYELHAFLT
jgi:hypothetical protein